MHGGLEGPSGLVCFDRDSLDNDRQLATEYTDKS